MRRLVKTLSIVLGALIGITILYPLARIVFYRQVDDDGRVELKRSYLADLGAVEPLSSRPNFVVILFDDLGYGDVGAYGGRAIRTPHIDRLAAEGTLFRHAYSASPYCSGSRAGLLTGRYPVRAGMDHVVQPAGSLRDLLIRMGGLNRRLPAEEILLSEVLFAAGYRTAIFGKWHLGDQPPSLPNDRGFSTFYGLLHSNDQGEPTVRENDRIVEPHPIDQSTLTWRYTERAVDFIRDNRGHPFFLYIPHTFPHVPLHAPAERLGTSEGGLYGDVVEELDASVGAVVAALEAAEVDENTLIIVTSDNGPWFQGSAGGTRGRKLDIFEGGMRVPFVAFWPGRIPGGRVSDEAVMGIDLFPTVLELAGLAPPNDRVIDGRSLVDLLEGRESRTPRGPIYFHQIAVPKAVRDGRFKYHDRHGVFYGNPMDWPWGPMKARGPWLFDLALDVNESYDVSQRHPETFRRLGRNLEAWKQELRSNPRGWL